MFSKYTNPSVHPPWRSRFLHARRRGIPVLWVESALIINREAKEFGGSAHVTVPKDWRGADVKVIRVSDSDETDDQDE